jgi:hypothetical protein
VGHRFRILPGKPVLCVEVFGDLSLEEVLDITKEGEDLAVAKGIHRTLVCFHRVRTALSLRDIHELVRFYEIVGVLNTRRIALVIPQSEKWALDFEFYRIACLSRGYHPRRFESREEALCWLLAGEVPALEVGRSEPRPGEDC